MLAEPHRIATPAALSPRDMAKSIADMAAHFKWRGPIGVGFPGVIVDGRRIMTAANVHGRFVGVDGSKLFGQATGCRVAMINDAAAAGLAEMRVGNAVKENEREFGGLSYQGWRRLGLRDVILPELERFWREDRPWRDVAAELAYRTVQQHLQIAWSRLQVDLRRDVALLNTEGDKWFSRGKGFSGGRTASRLQQALGWLNQLKLIDKSGITADGDFVLQGALKTLSEGAAA